jgi:small GTP-binding protein
MSTGYDNTSVQWQTNATLKVTVAMFGLDNAGKTSLVHAIGGQPTSDTTPTMGFAPHTFMGGQFELSVFDLGGASRFRGIWHNYYSDVHGILYVVDSSDKERLAESKEVLASILADPRASGKPLLVLANKQDQPGAMKGSEVFAALGQQEGPLMKVVECVAVSNPVDSRVDTSMEWMLSTISTQYQALSTRIRQQTSEDKANQEKQRKEQRERVQLARKTDYIVAKDVHFFFEQLAGRVLLDTPKDPTAYIINDLKKASTGVKKVQVAMFGLDNAGKTTLVHAIGGQPTTDTTPTIGFVPHTLKNPSYEVVVFDLGGASNFRGIWHNYYSDVHGILYVVDSTDKERLTESKEVLASIFGDPRAAGKPLLILANKQDQPGAFSNSEVLAALGLTASPIVNIIECVGIRDPVDPMIDSGMEWLLKTIAAQYSQLSVKIVQHLTEDKAKRRMKLEEQRARINPEAAQKDTRSDAERSVTYIKESGVHFLLERLAATVLADQPDNLVEHLLVEIQKK